MPHGEEYVPTLSDIGPLQPEKLIHFGGKNVNCEETRIRKIRKAGEFDYLEDQ